MFLWMVTCLSKLPQYLLSVYALIGMEKSIGNSDKEKIFILKNAQVC